MYCVAVYDMRFRPGPFNALEACLKDLGIGVPLPAFFDDKPLVNHVFTYYGLAQSRDFDPDLLQRLIHEEPHVPVWLRERYYRNLVSSDDRALAIEAQRIPLAAIRMGGGGTKVLF